MKRNEVIRIRGIAIKTHGELNRKIEEAKLYFPSILCHIPEVDSVEKELACAIDALDSRYDPINPLELRPLTSKAWDATSKLFFWESKFLVSLFAIERMWSRLGSLHLKIAERHNVREEISKFNAIRLDKNKSIPEKRKAFIWLEELMRVAERESKELMKRERLREVLSLTQSYPCIKRIVRRAVKKRRRLIWLTGSRDEWDKAILPQS